MRSLLRVVAAVARNRALTAVMVAYGVFSATQNAAWIGMLVYAYDRGGAGTAGAVAVAQLLPAALLAPVAAAIADRRSPVGVLVGGYLVQVAGMLATALAIGLEVPPAAYMGAVVASAAVATTRPAQTPLVPGLVHHAEELTAVNALTGWIESASLVASSAATGVLLTVAGPGLGIRGSRRRRPDVSRARRRGPRDGAARRRRGGRAGRNPGRLPGAGTPVHPPAAGRPARRPMGGHRR